MSVLTYVVMIAIIGVTLYAVTFAGTYLYYLVKYTREELAK